MVGIAEPEVIADLAETTFATKFTVTGGSGTLLNYTINTIDGNVPNQNGNTLFLWQASTLNVPPGKPIASTSVNLDSPTGSGVWQVETPSKKHLLGFAVGTDVKNICALVLIDENKKQIGQFHPSCILKDKSADYVEFDYMVPKGKHPMSDGDWYGLWKGDSVDDLYDKEKAYVAMGKPSKDESSGTAVLTYKFPSKQKFTIGYFKGGYGQPPQRTTLASALTFTSP
ncbi:hypothetical protein [Streptomyces sp. CT34]|uniref:hypothetical protein n=1 Tax=Streptomyces sp. CT34 TaxID=1553907 RepID=UPI0005B78B55|nr:hypothetical protein [Streptomyces sp. CT34]